MKFGAGVSGLVGSLLRIYFFYWHLLFLICLFFIFIFIFIFYFFLISRFSYARATAGGLNLIGVSRQTKMYFLIYSCVETYMSLDDDH